MNDPWYPFVAVVALTGAVLATVAVGTIAVALSRPFPPPPRLMHRISWLTFSSMGLLAVSMLMAIARLLAIASS